MCFGLCDCTRVGRSISKISRGYGEAEEGSTDVEKHPEREPGNKAKRVGRKTLNTQERKALGPSRGAHFSEWIAQTHHSKCFGSGLPGLDGFTRQPLMERGLSHLQSPLPKPFTFSHFGEHCPWMSIICHH